jgi:D-glycero-D-manno-heptose 1,7-bisphosphate phosphatase
MVDAGKRAVFLDRDGVINEAVWRDQKPYSPSSVTETIIVRDARGSLAALKQRGFLLVVVTNQPDLRRRSITWDAIEQIHEFLSSQLPIDDFFVCGHDDQDDCDCRKPRPGLFITAAAKHNIDVGRSYLIGDRWRDIDAGAAAGCRTIFIDYCYDERRATHDPDVIVSSLSEAVEWILKQELATE